MKNKICFFIKICLLYFGCHKNVLAVHRPTQTINDFNHKCWGQILILKDVQVEVTSKLNVTFYYTNSIHYQ